MILILQAAGQVVGPSGLKAEPPVLTCELCVGPPPCGYLHGMRLHAPHLPIQLHCNITIQQHHIGRQRATSAASSHSGGVGKGVLMRDPHALHDQRLLQAGQPATKPGKAACNGLPAPAPSPSRAAPHLHHPDTLLPWRVAIQHEQQVRLALAVRLEQCADNAPHDARHLHEKKNVGGYSSDRWVVW